jgi:hypothetical protein
MTTYTVTGSTAYMGHPPGEQFTASLEPSQERRALERGSIKKTVAPKKKEEEETDDA